MSAVVTRILVALVALVTAASASARLCDATGRVRVPMVSHGADCCCAPTGSTPVVAAAEHRCCDPASGDDAPVKRDGGDNAPSAAFIESSPCAACGPAVPPQTADERSVLPPLSLTLLPIADAPPLRWTIFDDADRQGVGQISAFSSRTTLLALGSMLTC